MLKVVLQEPLEAEWLQRLSSVQTVNKIGTNEWELGCTDVALAQRQLMELALRQNLNIVSLQAGGTSLEEVFRELTARQ